MADAGREARADLRARFLAAAEEFPSVRCRLRHSDGVNGSDEKPQRDPRVYYTWTSGAWGGHGAWRLQWYTDCPLPEWKPAPGESFSPYECRERPWRPIQERLDTLCADAVSLTRWDELTPLLSGANHREPDPQFAPAFGGNPLAYWFFSLFRVAWDHPRGSTLYAHRQYLTRELYGEPWDDYTLRSEPEGKANAYQVHADLASSPPDDLTSIDCYQSEFGDWNKPTNVFAASAELLRLIDADQVGPFLANSHLALSGAEPPPNHRSPPHTLSPEPLRAATPGELWRTALERSQRAFDVMQSAGLTALFNYAPESLSGDDVGLARRTLPPGIRKRVTSLSVAYVAGFQPGSGWPLGLETPGIAEFSIFAAGKSGDETWKAFAAEARAAMRGLAGAPDGLYQGLGFDTRWVGSPKPESWLGFLFSLGWRPIPGSPLRAPRSVFAPGVPFGIPDGLDVQSDLSVANPLLQIVSAAPRSWCSVLSDLPAMSVAAIDVLLSIDVNAKQGGKKDKGGRPPNPLKPLAKAAWKAYSDQCKGRATVGEEFESYVEQHSDYAELVTIHGLSARKIHGLTK